MHPLPHVYVENEDEMTTLTIELEDTVMQARLELVYSLDEQRPAIMRSARLTNEGEKPLQIDRMMSFALDLPYANYTMLELTVPGLVTSPQRTFLTARNPGNWQFTRAFQS